MAKTKKHEMVRYDEENDVLYLIVNQTKVAKTISLDDLRLVDYDNKKERVGIEFISASDGLDLRMRPHPRVFENCWTRPVSTSPFTPEPTSHPECRCVWRSRRVKEGLSCA